MSRCARCDWQDDHEANGTPKVQLALHALEAEHPLCPICARSLTNTDPGYGCERCLTHARSLLAGIVTMYSELPLHLGRSHGRLPGGDPLVMLAAGSQGLAETGETSRPNDPPSIAFELGWWAVAWQDDREDPKHLGHSPARIVANASRYLEVHARWAAASSRGFPEFVADLERLHNRLERTTAHDLPQQRANADCFDCGGKLVRKADPKTGIFDIEGAVECRQCGETYDPVRYQLALRVSWEADLEGWVPLTAAARLVGANVETVETWAKRGHVQSACRVEDRRKIVWWPDVQERRRFLDAERLRRQEREAQRAAERMAS